MSELSIFAVLADALKYPYPGLALKLQANSQNLPASLTRTSLQTFVQNIQELSLGEWEELYTRTLDLNPTVAPYVGYQVWGDGYARGNFMAALNRAYRTAEIEVDGELPDHLGAILACLGAGAPLLPELVENFQPAIEKMLATLRKVEPENPYVALLEAIAQTVNFGTVQQAS